VPPQFVSRLPAIHTFIHEWIEPSCLYFQPQNITALLPVFISRPTENSRLSWRVYCGTRNSPGNDDEHVKPVPRLGEVSLLADDSHRRHLDQHLDGEEDEDEVVEDERRRSLKERGDKIPKSTADLCAKCGPDESERNVMRTSQQRTDEDRIKKTKRTGRREVEVVEDEEHSAADGGTHFIGARLVQAQRETVEQDHAHTYSLEPRAHIRQGFTIVRVIY